MLECLINGEISSFVTSTNRGLNYGDGLFETMSVHNGQPHWWQAHMDRLSAGCERLGLIMPAQAILLREVQTVSAGSSDAVVKIVLTRNSQGRGYAPKGDGSCDRIVSAYEFPSNNSELLAKGVRAGICCLRLAIQPELGGLKHLNRIEQVLASAETFEDGISEGILLDREDNVISAISANIFLVLENRLLTPRLDRSGVRGVVRSQILGAFKARCEQRRIQLDLLHEADEVFITNSVRGIVPLRSIDQQEYRVGPVTREIQSWFGLRGKN
jgi:4-amino-4-deoxychorismate lyase